MSFFFDAANKINKIELRSHTVKRYKATIKRRDRRKRILTHSRKRVSPLSLPFKAIAVKLGMKRDRLINGLLIPTGATGTFYRIPVNLCGCGCLLGEHDFSGSSHCTSCSNCKRFHRATEVDCRRMLRNLKKR